MDTSSEWELSKENIQPLRQGRIVSSLTTALQHTPMDLQIIKDQKDAFETQLRMYNGDDPLEVWDSYIKWTEQNFPRGGKEGNLMELLQRCLTHFRNNEVYKDDPRFVHIWIKFANFIDDPVEIYTFMFDQKIGCGLSLLYEEWATFLERLGNTKKADTIYLEGISRGAQPLGELKRKHSEFQMRVARGITLQPRTEEEMNGVDEDLRTVLGGLRSDKKNRVGTFRTGSAKLGQVRPLGTGNMVPQQQQGIGFQVFQDENAPMTVGPQQTGERRSIPTREQLQRENEQAPGVWTKAKAPQKRGVVSTAAATENLAFQIHEDEHAEAQQIHASAALVDSHVLSIRKMEKPGHMLDTIRNTEAADQRPMYCKDKVYCGTQEFSFEELKALRYMEKKRRREQEEEQKRLAEQLQEMRLLREQVMKDLETMRAEQHQLLAMQRLHQQTSAILGSGDSCGLNQPSPWSVGSNSFVQQLQGSGQLLAPSVPSVGSSLPSASSVGSTPSFSSLSAPRLPSALSSSSSSFTLQKQQSHSIAPIGPGPNSSINTPVLNTTGPSLPSSTSSSGSGGRFQLHQRSAGPTPDNTSRHSLTSVSPTINMKEALQMVQGMYNATLDCDKINNWAHDAEMTEMDQEPLSLVPVAVFDENQTRQIQPTTFPVFCDENAPVSEYRAQVKASGLTAKRGLGCGRLALQEKPLSASAPAIPASEMVAEDYLMTEGTEFYPQYDVTLAAVGSQDSFAVAARTASTPFGLAGEGAACLPAIPLSSIKPHKASRECSDEELAEAGASLHTNHSDIHNSQHAQFCTFNSTRATANTNDLSPIIEGSSEGSSEESKSQATAMGTSAHTSASSGGVFRSQAHRAATEGGKEIVQQLAAKISDQHVIDTSCYVHAEPDERTEALLSMSVCIDPHNPFDEVTNQQFLKLLKPPLDQREGYIPCRQNVPNFSGSQFVNLGVDTYQLHKMIGEGGYAKVYCANSFNTNLDDSMDTRDIEPYSNDCVIKVQKPASPWEFYICSEVHQRLKKQGLEHLSQCMMSISHGYFYNDGSCLVSEYCAGGSLLGMVNKIKDKKEVMCNLEPVAAFITVQLLQMVEALHRCHIIHGDIKPDNILLMGLPQLANCKDPSTVFGPSSYCLRLVDFGQSIDMSLYPPETTFMAKVGTSGFQCIEMLTDQPWTYQTDMFGLVGSIHVLVFGHYMKVYCSQGQWHMTSSFQRKWKVDLWKKLFHQLLNIPNCDHLPDLAALRQEFEDHFMDNLAPDFHTVLAKVSSNVRSK